MNVRASLDRPVETTKTPSGRGPRVPCPAREDPPAWGPATAAGYRMVCVVGSVLAFLTCTGLGAAAATEIVTVQFPRGDRVVGRIIEQNDTRITIESPALGRIEASAIGITMVRGEVSPPPAPVAAARAKPVEKAPPTRAELEGQAFMLFVGFLDLAARSAVQPGWTDWFKGWHGLLSAGVQFEDQLVKRQRVLALGEIAKTVKQTEVRLSGFRFTQSTADKDEIDHSQLKLRLRQGIGARWVLQNENTWTSNPLVFGLEQEVYAASLHYRLWRGQRGEFQLGPGVVRTDTKYVIRPLPVLVPSLIIPLRMRHTGWGGQAHFKWAPLSWLAVESDASQATFRNVLPGHHLELASVKSRVLMLVHKPWTIGLRHDYNRIALRGQWHFQPFGPPFTHLNPAPFELAPYTESIVWLDFGYRF